MKTNKQPILYLLAFMAILCGCSESEFEGVSPDGNETIPLFGIRVSDSGYKLVPDTDTPQTRVNDVGYQTIFTAGDQIGVFAVKDGVIFSEVNNLCLTAQLVSGTTDSLTWADATGNAPLYIPGADYYAYYPYQQQLNGTLAPGGNPDANTFFADVVLKWTPVDDQSIYDVYTKQDLMIAKSSINAADKSLSFAMQHQMALVVIDMPKVSFKLSNSDRYNTGWFINPPNSEFKDLVPCHMSDNKNRFLVNPARKYTFAGSYEDDIYGFLTRMEWSFEAESMQAGYYKIFTVDAGRQIKFSNTFILQTGDFYMRDGSVVGKDVTLTEAQKANCIGIFYLIGNYNDSSNPFETAGYVISLWDATDPEDSGSGTMTWTYGGYESVQDMISAFWEKPYKDHDFRVTDEIQGYGNTVGLREYNKYVINPANGYGANSDKRIKPIDALAVFSSKHPVPAKGSGWYWPSLEELRLIYKDGFDSAGKTLLNTQLEKVGGTPFGNDCYWSSTEKDGENAYYVDFSDGTVREGNKGKNAYRMRPILSL